MVYDIRDRRRHVTSKDQGRDPNMFWPIISKTAGNTDSVVMDTCRKWHVRYQMHGHVPDDVT